ncbi:hypothetical protein GTZ99_02985 [Novosphingobium sp. FSY-8]|uniref:Uncharacterized protein n=1 Tax=Novosphingobium ovatum TaxID=1908523 RepID=A0ABW9XAG8_9SPHN|nr:hypothetical protein [Novosphingobium ovatum]NBC35516.1 hypothetical protein [Novosphingobium ovatum]
MPKPLTHTMRQRLLAAYDHAAEMAKAGFHPLGIIRSLQANHRATYGYACGTERLRCAGVEVTCTSGTHPKMLNAWMAKAAARLDEERAAGLESLTGGKQ